MEVAGSTVGGCMLVPRGATVALTAWLVAPVMNAGQGGLRPLQAAAGRPWVQGLQRLGKKDVRGVARSLAGPAAAAAAAAGGCCCGLAGEGQEAA